MSTPPLFLGVPIMMQPLAYRPAVHFSNRPSNNDDGTPPHQTNFGLEPNDAYRLREQLMALKSKGSLKPWMWLAAFLPASIMAGGITLQNIQEKNQLCLIMATQTAPQALASVIKRVCDTEAPPVFPLFKGLEGPRRS
jgi:hypothetical protein